MVVSIASAPHEDTLMVTPRVSIICVSALVTRRPGKEVSTSSVKYSRVEQSTTLKDPQSASARGHVAGEVDGPIPDSVRSTAVAGRIARASRLRRVRFTLRPRSRYYHRRRPTGFPP
jgi:hypothetical protein